MTPEKARTTLMGREKWESVKYEGKPLSSGWMKEKWYGTEYMLGRSPVPNIEKAIGGLALPRHNAFIPTNFNVEKKEVSEVGFSSFSL